MPGASSLDHTRDDLLALGKGDLSALVTLTLDLQAEVRKLRDAAAQNSGNSSRPPSGDREKPKPQSLRGKSGRKPGGQPGHPGKTLKLSGQPDETVPHPLQQCPCGQDLSDQPVQGMERRQVFDLPPMQLRCIEHQAEMNYGHKTQLGC